MDTQFHGIIQSEWLWSGSSHHHHRHILFILSNDHLPKIAKLEHPETYSLFLRMGNQFHINITLAKATTLHKLCFIKFLYNIFSCDLEYLTIAMSTLPVRTYNPCISFSFWVGLEQSLPAPGYINDGTARIRRQCCRICKKLLVRYFVFRHLFRF